MTYNPNTQNNKIVSRYSLVNLGSSASLRMWLVSICAFLVILQSAFGDSFRSLGLAFAVTSAALLTEFLFLYKKQKTGMLKDGSAVASALIFTMLLPNMISPIYAILGIIFAVAVIKHCFGGLGSNWLNPAAGGWLFIRLAWPAAFSRALQVPPGFTAGASIAETHVRPFLNSTVFALLKIELPPSGLDLLSFNYPGIIADRGIFALLIGSILILALKACRTWIPAIWLAVFIFLIRLVPGGTQYGGIFTALCSGGTLAAVFMLAADPATNAKSVTGCCIFAALGGFLA